MLYCYAYLVYNAPPFGRVEAVTFIIFFWYFWKYFPKHFFGKTKTILQKDYNKNGAAAGEGLKWIFEYSFLKNCVLISLPLFCIYYINIEKSKTLFLKCFHKNTKKIIKLLPRPDRKKGRCKLKKSPNIITREINC